MNRENKRKKYDKNFYRTHPCIDPFTCKNCGQTVVPEGAGSDHRNHCPYCLTSVHLDEEPGDRASDCHGKMEPIGVWVRKNGEWALIHRCTICGRTDVSNPELEFRYCSRCKGYYCYCEEHINNHSHIQ